MEVAKALGGSFKLVTLAPKTVREMTELPKETQKNGDTNKSKDDRKKCNDDIQHLPLEIDDCFFAPRHSLQDVCEICFGCYL